MCEDELMIVVPASKWELFTAINNYVRCVNVGHDWMYFNITNADGSITVFTGCRRCGLDKNASGNWDAAYRTTDDI